MKVVTIYSSGPLMDEQEQQIKGILLESECPNESLSATFPDFECMEGNDIYFHGTQKCRTEIMVGE